MQGKSISRRGFPFAAILTLVFLIPFSSLTAQETPQSAEQTLSLGDVVTATLAGRENQRISYMLNIEDTAAPFDIVLFSRINSTLNVVDAEGDRIRSVDYMWDYGYEVFSWQPGDTIPVQIEVYFSRNDNEDYTYTLSILPTEVAVNEDPVLGEQVKRWIEVRQSERSNPVTLRYLLYTPQDYDENQQYPLILFMHGLGETGPRLDFLKDQVIPRLIEDGEDFPFIIASPQLNYNEFWDQQQSIDRIANFVSELQSEFPIDPDRIYITGLSMGGSGAWHFASSYPDVPAAVVSMAGFYSYGSPLPPRNICEVARIPFWIVHSEEDEVIPFSWEQGLVDGLTECGAEVQYTVYRDADHTQTFERGFAEPSLYEWLLEQHR